MGLRELRLRYAWRHVHRYRRQGVPGGADLDGGDDRVVDHRRGNNVDLARTGVYKRLDHVLMAVADLFEDVDVRGHQHTIDSNIEYSLTDRLECWLHHPQPH